MPNLFIAFFYQPLFNLLVLVYNLLALIDPKDTDMGIAVIIFTIAFRILWLPISAASDRPEKEKRAIAQRVEELKKEFAADPVRRKKEIRDLLRSHPGPVLASTFDIFFQVLIALMLYRMFSSGLEGADFHLLYKFIPQPDHPFNLTFLGKYDLTRSNLTLNLIQSLFILAAEVLSALVSPFPTARRDLMTVIFLPIISFLIFMALPAGKKLFIITTLAFSIVLMLVKQIIFLYHSVGKSLNNYVVSQALKKTQES